MTVTGARREESADSRQRCLDAAYRFLAARPRSTAEMRRRLAQKGFDQATVDGVIDRLVTAKLLDDGEFAEYWADQRARFRPRGPIAVAAELRAKGIDPSTVRRALDSMPAADTLAAEVAQRAAKRFSHLDDATYLRRMVAVLLRRGFPQGVAFAAARAARAGMAAEADEGVEES